MGKVHATDQDPYDVLIYSLNSQPVGQTGMRMSDLFEIDRQDGTLTALPVLDAGEYEANVSVTDGKFNSSVTVKINVEEITEEMLENAVVVRFRDISPQDFVLSHRKGFLKAVRSALGVRQREVVIISVQLTQGRKRATRNHFGEKKSDKISKEKVPRKKFQKFDNRTITKNHNFKDLNGKVRKSRQLQGGDLLDVLFTVKKSQSSGVFYTAESVSNSLIPKNPCN